MDLRLHQRNIIVAGASSGLGNAISIALLEEGANVIGIARNKDKLEEIRQRYPEQFLPLALDITEAASAEMILERTNHLKIYGMLFNAGGPPAKTIAETTLEDWDEAYRKVMRWKIDLTRQLLPAMEKQGEGRMIYLESASVKQPLENLVLSNSFRVAMVGFIKTLSTEMTGKGITFNVLAPGSHETAAINRTITKKMEQTGTSRETAIRNLAAQNTVGHLGKASDFASLACWLFSPYSNYINGQTISVDGGSVKGIMG
jgi:3-oxoacyl-[acyl-carrier protein] reductase